jgi:hypothetical protein
VIGTHTHVQTADERILAGGTACLTDAGMTGPHDGVIGIEKDAIIARFVTGLPGRFETATGDPRLNGVTIDSRRLHRDAPRRFNAFHCRNKNSRESRTAFQPERARESAARLRTNRNKGSKGSSGSIRFQRSGSIRSTGSTSSTGCSAVGTRNNWNLWNQTLEPSGTPGTVGRVVLSVSELNATIRDLLENQLQNVWVEGEISNARVWNTGHLYFTLKDGASQIKR